MKKVYLGMSGGVDSSVAALLLQQQGYNVTGIYMKNWSRDLPGSHCPWAEDLADAKRVAVELGIDFEVWDFEKDYKEKVVDYMLNEFQNGRTPNPDVMCNQEIKFNLFFEKALAHHADYIATGHYAAVGKSNSQKVLMRAADENKDQTYFLYRIPEKALEKTIFPLAELEKPAVKELAAAHGFKNAYKKESMGVCFVGEVGMKDFLKEYIHATPGEIREQETNKVLGYHEGAVFYTIGQRHGLYLGGGLPFYVVEKDLEKNIVYVSKDLNNSELWTQELSLTDLFLREPLKSASQKSHQITVRLRHRAPLIPATLKISNFSVTSKTSISDTAASKTSPSSSLAATLTFPDKIKRPAPGQSAVFYQDKICLGGGIILPPNTSH